MTHKTGNQWNNRGRRLEICQKVYSGGLAGSWTWQLWSVLALVMSRKFYQIAWTCLVSSPHSLTNGVPQGSVLGQHLFSLYTKSLGSGVRCHGLSYQCHTDKTALYFCFSPFTSQVAQKISDRLSDVSKPAVCLHNIRRIWPFLYKSELYPDLITAHLKYAISSPEHSYFYCSPGS